ncbi:MAG TPA: hypothetical protein VFP91_08570 [Vicinamibacterales bacterium]|nr:hypothetical protein [Vicinamibacterales bacterium]
MCRSSASNGLTFEAFPTSGSGPPIASERGADDVDDITDRIEKLKKQATVLSGGRMVSHAEPNTPPDVEEQFWKNVLAVENAPEAAPFDELLRAGLTLQPAAELDDGALVPKLWEVIRGLEDLGVYLEFTNHLSDRQLYTVLWTETLREPMALAPNDPNSGWHIDMTAASSDDGGVNVYLTYYADDEDRRRWAADYPDDVLPESRPLPFDRDRHLPSQWSSPPTGVDDDARMS